MSAYSFLTALAIFVFVLVTQPILSRFAVGFGLVDEPNHRKHHLHATPVAGGLAIICGLCLAAYLGVWPQSAPGLTLAIAIIFIMGFWDDLHPIRPRYRLLMQLIACSLAVVFSHAIVENLNNVFMPINVPLPYFLAAPLTILALVGLINAFNLSDGIDGLCAGYAAVAMFWTAIAAMLMMAESQNTNDLFSLTSTGFATAVGFLIYNMRYPGHQRASVFLGDNGSTVLGLLVGWLLIRATNVAGEESLHPVAAIYIVALPIADTITVVVRRWRGGQNITTPDCKHLHHLIVAHGYSVRRSVFALNSVAMLLGGFGVLASSMNVSMPLLFWGLLTMMVFYIVYSEKFWQAQSVNQTDTENSQGERTTLEHIPDATTN